MAATTDTMAPPASLRTLVERFDREAFDLPAGRAVIRLGSTGEESWDFVVDDERLELRPARQGQADAVLTADRATWESIARDVASGMRAFRSGRLRVRRNMHLGVGFLAATSPGGPGRFRFARVRTDMGSFSTIDAGTGEPIVMLHGLGANKTSFLPTIAALAPSYRTIAVDLLGFGDSDKPIAASYSPKYQARGVARLMDELGLARSHFIGHSMGGRVAVELGLRQPERARGLVLMTPAMAWLGERRWASYLRWIRPELGLLQIAPRPVVELLMRRLIPGADSSWAAPAVDEFVRAYTTARGRAALYAAGRQLYLDEPHGDKGFWTRLRSLAPHALFLWGRHDRLVPSDFMKHVERALPEARHVELECGHVPQFECPREAHGAIADFLGAMKPQGEKKK